MIKGEKETFRLHRTGPGPSFLLLDPLEALNFWNPAFQPFSVSLPNSLQPPNPQFCFPSHSDDLRHRFWFRLFLIFGSISGVVHGVDLRLWLAQLDLLEKIPFDTPQDFGPALVFFWLLSVLSYLHDTDTK